MAAWHASHPCQRQHHLHVDWPHDVHAQFCPLQGIWGRCIRLGAREPAPGDPTLGLSPDLVPVPGLQWFPVLLVSPSSSWWENVHLLMFFLCTSTSVQHWLVTLRPVYSVIMKEVDLGGESGRENFPGKCYVRPHLWTPNPKLYLIPTLAWCTNWVASFWDFLVRQTTIYHHQFPLAVIIITYQICTQHVQTRVNNRRDIILLNIIYSILLYYIIYQYCITQYYLLNIIYYITQYYLLLVQIYTCTQHTDSVCCYRD